MKIPKNALLVLAAVLTIAAILALFLLPHILLRTFAATYDLDLRYEHLKKAAPNRMIFEGLTVVDRPKGIGISAKNAEIDVLWSLPDPRNSTIVFNLKDVRFVKKEREAAASYDTLDNLVALPFSSNWLYAEISGKVRSSKGEVAIRDFMAKSDMMRLSFNGDIRRDNTIKSDILIYFSDELTKKIPPELTRLVLTQEDPGWKSLAVKLEGNYTMPTINVSSKLFRLNIGVKDGPS